VNKAFFFIGTALLTFSEYASAQKDYAFEIIFLTPNEIQRPYEELPSLEPVPALAKGIDLDALRALLLKRSEQQLFKDISELQQQPTNIELSDTEIEELTDTSLTLMPLSGNTSLLHELPINSLSPTTNNAKQSLMIGTLSGLEITPAAGISAAIVEPLPIDLAQNFDVALPKLDASEAFTQWLPLGSNDLQLADLITKLEKKAGYRVLHHMAWRQPASNASTSKAIAVHAGFRYQHKADQPEVINAEPLSDTILEAQKIDMPKPPEVISIALKGIQPINFDAVEHTGLLRKSFNELSELATITTDPDVIYELEGSLRVEVGRYLHLYTDLVFRIEQVESNSEEHALRCMPAMDDFRIKNHHRMRSRQVYYIDHPMLGILVQATPISAPKPEQLPQESVN